MKKNKKTAAPAARPPAKSTSLPVPSPLVILLVIVVLGLVLRAVNLGYLSFWGDELYHVFTAESLIEKGQALLPTGQAFNDAIMFTKLISLADRLFGVGETSNRLVPLLFGVLTIALTFFAARQLFRDVRVGLIAAFWMAVLPWYILRSQVLRAYTMGQFFFLLFAYFFYRGFEPERDAAADRPSRLPAWLHGLQERFGVDIIMLLLSLVSLKICHSLQGGFALEAGPGVLVYSLVMLIRQARRNGIRDKAGLKYLLVSGFGILGLVSAPVVFNLLSVSPIATYFNDWNYYIGRLSQEPWWAFKKYWTDTIYVLHPVVWIMALAGMAALKRRPERGRLFALAIFGVPFLVQSFVFISPNVVKAQYLFFVFPFFLMFVGSGFVTVAELAAGKMAAQEAQRKTVFTAVLAASLVLLGIVPLKKTWQTVTTRKHGDLGDRAAERFANWRGACTYIEPRLKPDDVVIATQPWSVLYYLGRVDCHVRMGFNKDIYLKEGYKEIPNQYANQNPPLWPLRDVTTGARVLKDFNMFRWTLETYPRGWLVVCHKFFNPAFVDKRAVDLIKKQTRLVYNDPDRSVWVLHWDRTSQPAPPPMVTVTDRDASFDIGMPDPRRLPGPVSLQLDIAGADEAVLKTIAINGVTGLPFQSVPGGKRQIVEAELQPAWLKAGANTITLRGGDHGPYTVYHAGMTLKRGVINISL